MSEPPPGKMPSLVVAAGRVHRIVDAILALLHLDLGGARLPCHVNAGPPLASASAAVMTFMPIFMAAANQAIWNEQIDRCRARGQWRQTKLTG
jgi:hypothetical protein